MTRTDALHTLLDVPSRALADELVCAWRACGLSERDARWLLARYSMHHRVRGREILAECELGVGDI